MISVIPWRISYSAKHFIFTITTIQYSIVHLVETYLKTVVTCKISIRSMCYEIMILSWTQEFSSSKYLNSHNESVLFCPSHSYMRWQKPHIWRIANELTWCSVYTMIFIIWWTIIFISFISNSDVDKFLASVKK